MAVSPIDATVGGTDSNSYATQVEIQQQMDDRLYSDAWDGATDEEQKQSMIMCALLLDDLVNWYGEIASDTQALRWPRSGVSDCDGRSIDDDVIPDAVKQAQGELSLYMLQGDKLKIPVLLEKGIKSAKVGPLAVTIENLAVADMLNQTTIAALGCLGQVKGNATTGGVGQVELVRS